MNRRVVITGCGVVSPIGCSKEAVWESLQAGKSGVVPIEAFSTAALPVHAGGEVQEFTGKIDDFGPLDANVKKTIRKGLKVMCREIQMGVAASQKALVDANLDLSQCDPTRVGVVFGSDYIMTLPEEFAAGVKACVGDDGSVDLSSWAEKGMPQVTPLWLLKYLPNMPACHVAIYNDLQGPNNSITQREASANLAVMEAYSTIARGSADTLLVGATGSRIHPLRTLHTVMQEEVAPGNVEPSELSRPFDRARQGIVVGEGAATLIVETLESAQARGANIIAEVLGFGSSAVMTRNALADRRQAMANAMRRALEIAEVSPAQVGHVHAHGLSTQQCDIDEAQAIRDVFGDHPIPVVAAKSYFGNLGAASGMVELIASIQAMSHGRLFTTLNYTQPDPECPVDVVTNPEHPSGTCVLNVNVSPQGQASAALIRIAA